jgi:hypothetical protein
MIPHDQARYWNSWGDKSIGKRSRREISNSFPEENSRIVFLTGRSEEALRDLQLDQVHIGFLDAMHEYDALQLEFSYVSERQQAGDIVVFDDVTPLKFPGVVRFVDDLEARGKYSVNRVTSPLGNTVAVATRNA